MSNWWPFYHDDFWDDPNVIRLSEREQLAYIWLLGLQWKYGALPASDEDLAALCRRFRGWPKLWASLQHLFVKNEHGERISLRMQFEREQMAKSRRKVLERKARWTARKRGSETFQERSGNAQGGRSRDALQDRTGQEKTEQKPNPPPPSQEGGVPSKTRKSAVEEIPIPDVLRTPAFEAAWIEFQEYRRERKFPAWKRRTVEANLAEWATWGPAVAAEALRNSIKGGWQGVFHPRPNSNHQPPRPPPPPTRPPTLDELFGGR